MNEYLDDLERYLAVLPDDDRADIISYYREYIEDAELGDRAAIEGRLGTAKHLARVTLADASVKAEEQSNADDQRTTAPRRNNWRNVWMIILGVFALPIGVPMIIALALIFIAAIIVVGALILSLVAIVASIFIVGVAAVIAGFSALFTEWATGVLFIGAGLVAIGLMLIAVPGSIALVRWFGRWVARMVRSTYKRLSERYHVGGAQNEE